MMHARQVQRTTRAVPVAVSHLLVRSLGTSAAGFSKSVYSPRTNTKTEAKQFGTHVVNQRSRMGILTQAQARWFSEAKKEEGDAKPAAEATSEAKPEATMESTTEATPTPEVEEVAKPTVKGAEHVVGDAQAHEFKAETRQLLDIVTHSLYQDKEVFIRELVSNGSDALEKARHTALTEQSGEDLGDLRISITLDEQENLIGIQDNGIGMSSEELIENLGTIARSGSKAFLKQMAEGNTKEEVASNIIGKFGVGFYSAFMVADSVTVYSRKRGEEYGHCWESTGDGSYKLFKAEGVEQGTKIVLHLRDDAKEYCKEPRIKEIVGKYSSFVSFPVDLNGVKINDVKALWQKAEGEISDEEHKALFRHVSGEYEAPMYTLVYKADAPIDIKSVFYVPMMNMEKFGMAGKTVPGVHLYSRRVLIQSNAKDLLPEYFRWVKGVVDSEDLPLSISRENMQDMKLLAKLKTVLTRRIIRWLQDQAKKDEEGYLKFYEQYGLTLKEGVAMDQQNGPSLAKLLRYPSTTAADTKPTSFESYVSRMKEGQDTIYYLVANTRKQAEGSPYYEAFKRAGIEVLYCYQEHDEIVLGNLGKFMDKPLKSIEVAEPPSMDKPDEEKTEEDKQGEDNEGLSEEKAKALTDWMKDALAPRVSEVMVTTRLVDSPAIISEHDNVVTRRMMQMAEFQSLGVSKPSAYKLQVNLKHPLLIALNDAREREPGAAKLVAEQILDNAIISAGILDDVRDMLPRLTELMQKALK
mmetsp:Transcript_9212/g.18379  ORF Transcript_9212/g.18379 Transcript_9212/m.18379 type:complete len:751 (-) Transcript_9212:210-2462(-)